MANTRTFFRSFASGELAPEMYGRIDDVHYQTGAAKVRNFISRPQGPVENRPGFKYVATVKDSSKKSRLIPFTYSTTQTMVIELGAGYIRFYTQGAYLATSGLSAYNGATTYAIGDLVTYLSRRYYCIAATTGNLPTNTTYWYQLPTGTIYEIPSPYAEADLFDIHYVQSADVLTLVHPSYAPRELRRYGTTNWRLATISFAASVTAPTSAPTLTAYRGRANQITAVSLANPGVFTTNSEHAFARGQSVYISGVSASMTQLTDGFYIIHTIPSVTQFTLMQIDTGVVINTSAYTAYSGSGGLVQASIRAYDIDNYYVITAVAANGIDESVVSPAGHVVNNLYVDGSYNQLSWSAVSGAARYNVYKRQSGLYGLIGQSSTTSFVDNNISPDLGNTPKTADTVFAGTGDYPQAVSYFEQRRVFAGTNNDPQHLWFTRSGTESDMSYSIPVEDGDRVSIRVASREANTIRHIVPLTQLLLLTSAAEWRVSPINSDAITPSTISVRPQAYVGANNVQPTLVNNTVVYCSARGGHVRELGYSWQASGFVTGDLSIRATHLFDTYDILDMCYTKAPYQVLWFVSSTGNLLGLTYVPEQEIGAWHQHDTDGVFESCTAVAEGTEDALYVIVKRTVNGNTVRYVERMQSRTITDASLAFFVDSGLSFDGTNTDATQLMTLTGGTIWGPSELLNLHIAPIGMFGLPGYPGVGDVIVLTGTDGEEYRLTINTVVGANDVSVRPDRVIPSASGLRGVATSTWASAFNTFSGLSHLEGKTVSILGDGAVMTQKVVTSGSITVDRPAVKVIAGLPYESDLQTLPLTLQIDGFGQGHMKNINKAWLRVLRSSGIFIGPDVDHLVEAKQRTTEPYGTPPELKSDEVLIVLNPSWASSGQVYVRQSDPLPLTIVSMTVEASIGG